MKGLYTIANGKDESVNGQYTFSFIAIFLKYMALGAYLEGYAGKRTPPSQGRRGPLDASSRGMYPAARLV